MSEESVLLSVIIPAYNCEQYIRQCIQSIVDQNVESYEILVVDDGSTDQTGEICDAMAAERKEVRVLHKKNEGQGIARNEALSYARGEYIAFVDADDFAAENGYRPALAQMIQNNADLGIFRWKVIQNGCKEAIAADQPSTPSVESVPFEEVIIDMSAENSRFGGGSCNKLYRKSVLLKNDVKFPSERTVISEDYLFVFDLLPRCRNIIASDIAIFYYRKNQSSFTHTYHPEYFSRLENFIRYIESSKLYSEDVLSMTAIKKFSFIKTCIIQEVKFKKLWEGTAAIKQICQAGTTQRVLKEPALHHLGVKNQIAAFLIRNRHAFLLYVLYKLK